jgi:peptidoglycan hydrolase-like protein with peptidoglycan-binding domain
MTVDRTLRDGMKGAQVEALQQALGFDDESADGVFGPATRSALQAFQKAHGLVADGVAGPETLKALDLR